jgi:hypothetical protein
MLATARVTCDTCHVAYLVEDVKVHSPDPLPEDEKVDVWS